MLNIIEPKDHSAYRSRIESFLDLLKVYQSFSLVEEEKENATFIIGSDNQRGVYGGAVLYQQKVCDLYKDMGKIISSFQPERQSVWAGRIGLYIEDESTFNRETIELRENFYQDLLKHFIDFGDKQHVDFLTLNLCSSDFHRAKNYGCWSYTLEISSANSSDDLFHCILLLDPRKNGGIK